MILVAFSVNHIRIGWHSNIIGTLRIYDSDSEDNAWEKCISFLLWNFSFIWNYPVCLSVLKLTPAEYATEIRKISRCDSRSPNNAELGHFTLLFCRGQPRNIPRFKTHVHRLNCFALQTFYLVTLSLVLLSCFA